MDISIENNELVFRWNTPPLTYFYDTSNVSALLATAALYTTAQAPASSGLLRTEMDVGNKWSLLEVSLEFKGYAGKRQTNLFRGRMTRRDPGKNCESDL